MEVVEKRKQFGTRYLVNESETFKYNAWDNVDWNDDQKVEAESKIAEQKKFMLDGSKAQRLIEKPYAQWDKFYGKHQEKFFRNRNWLLTEFPELDTKNLNPNKRLQVLEVGCGAGNTVFPLLKTSKPGQLFLYCCDYSFKAIEIVKQNPNYDERRCHAFTWDITSDETAEIGEEFLDIILCIYVLSAVPPEQHRKALHNLCKLLKPGGLILFKDYGQYDMTQLRFKEERLIHDNLYCRGDGTLVYFFVQEELDDLLKVSGFVKLINVLDRRLIVNRAKRLKMYRVWIQCKYQKPKTLKDFTFK